jgi:hypothetical protein
LAPWDWLDPAAVAYLVKRYGGTREAALEAMQLSEYAQEFAALGVELETDADGHPYPRLRTRGVEQSFWKLVEAAVGPAAQDFEPPATLASKRPSRSPRGRREGKVSIYEANLAAEIYVRNRDEYDARDDGGAYAVHALYIEDRELSPTLLSRPMVGHLLVAIRAGWLPWDTREGRLRISDEFRTSKGTFTIPRPESRS